MDDSSFTLRAAEPRDVPDILGFIQALAHYEKLAHEVVATEQSLQRWLFGEDSVAEAVMAAVDGEPAGFALYFKTFSTFLSRPGIYLEDLFVSPRYRGRGIGSALVRFLAQIACERGYGRVEWAVLDWNDPAIRFYERIGAVPMSEWSTYRLTGENLRLMGQQSRKALPPR